MIKLGGNNIGKIYFGSNVIGKAYYGSELVYRSGGSPTPPTPTPVFYDRLVFDGTAYIETTLIPLADASYIVPMGGETQHVIQRMFMCRAGTAGFIGATLNSATTSQTRTFSIFYGSSSTASSNKALSWSTNTYTFYLTPNSFGWDTTNYSITKGSDIPTQPLIIGYNVSKTQTPFTGFMKTFKIYGSDAQNCQQASDFENFTPVATLRPCTYNGKAGFWYEEGSTFFGNTAESGTLTVANDE